VVEQLDVVPVAELAMHLVAQFAQRDAVVAAGGRPPPDPGWPGHGSRGSARLNRCIWGSPLFAVPQGPAGLFGRPGSSLDRQEAEIVSRNPACSPRATAAQDALLHDHVAHNLLGHLYVTEGKQNPPIRFRGIASMFLFALAIGRGLQEQTAS
jgi:hypothetical protein